MPPKKKRGGISVRGRRGRPPKNAATPTDSASPLPDLVETSNSSSPMSEDNNHTEMKQKLEMKIHKKFGIKYHVPDEILAPLCTTSALTNCAPSATSENVPISSSVEDDVAPEVSELQAQPQRDELEMKLEQLEVDDNEIQYEMVEDVAFSSYVEEVDSSNIPLVQEEGAFIEADGHEVVVHQEEECDDVYYVLDDSDELPEQENSQTCAETLVVDPPPQQALCLQPSEEVNDIEMLTNVPEVVPGAIPSEQEVKTEEQETQTLENDVKPSTLAMPIKSKAALKEYSIEEQIQALSEGALPIQEEQPITNSTAEETILNTKANGKKTKKNTTKRVNLKISAKTKKAAKEAVVKKASNGTTIEEDANVRRSSRIKTISTQKARSRGKGLVKKDGDVEPKVSDAATEVFATPSNSNSSDDIKPVKVKSRWRRSSELEMRDNCKTENESPKDTMEQLKKDAAEIERRLKQFAHLRENVYLTERLSCKEAKKMVCDCFLTPEEIEQGEYGCGDDCLNRLLMIECGNLCAVGDRCTNKRFQRFERAKVEAFCTVKKGLGIRAVDTILSGDFILEYVGEVLDPKKFSKRAVEYSKDKNQHHYFMSLRADAVIDATSKGNISRFINHSCEPNAETQKWTVNGELRIGFFSKRTIQPGEEITFDYQFQRYGKEAQKCFCETPTCRGWLGEEPDDDDDEDEDDDDEEEDEECENSKSADVQLPAAKAKKKATVKREKRIRKLKERKPRKDIFEDIGIDDEIQSLQQTGLKNQAQTLKLSRLMVRAKEGTQRIKVLKLLKKGEFPCRRLFLDYHGLRLIYGWMTDAQQMAKNANTYTFANSLKLEILQTLVMLPIPNKTMLQDSKVLPTVEKWSVKEEQSSPDSNGNSPSTCDRPEHPDNDTGKASEEKLQELVLLSEEIRRSAGMDAAYTNLLPELRHASLKEELLHLFADDFIPLDIPSKPLKPLVQPEQKYDLVEEIIGLAVKLLEEWAVLKEVFRIPKKERIEQMKEHEREADLRYQALSVEAATTDRRRDRYRSLQRPIRLECDRSKDYRPKNDRFVTKLPAMSKHERRELFARQAEEEERRRKQEQWNQHYKHFAMPPPDPRLTVFDPNRAQFVWNAQLGRWQQAEMHPPPHPFALRPPGHMEAPNVVQPHMQHANMGAMPPMPNIPPGPDGADDIDPSKVQFMGPIPPPVKLPPKWKRAHDKYGRPYYYHIKTRKPQWEPPEMLDDDLSPSSSDTSSLSSSSPSDDSESEDDMQLIMDIREKFRVEAQNKVVQEELYPPLIRTNSFEDMSPSKPKAALPGEEEHIETSPDANGILDPNTDVINSVIEPDELCISLEREKEIISEPLAKKRRVGLVQQLIISPRSEEDRLQYREEARKYRHNKEAVRKEKEVQAKHSKTTKPERLKCEKKVSVKVKLREMEASANSDEVKKVKETFRAAMAIVMVNILNPYRRADCKEARITSTEDFKHLARKLTHFVMLKELKHCDRLQDLECTESVKLKAKEFVRKYMSKFGVVYHKPPDEVDNFN